MKAKEMKVVITDAKYSSYELERSMLSKLNAKLIECHCRTEEEVIKNCKDADAILTHHAPMTRKVIEHLEKPKIIARYGIGVDNVDLESATKKGIFVTNVVYDVCEVADHTVALILGVIRKIPLIHQSTKSGEWNWRRFQPIFRFKGKTVGIIGFGRVGREVAKRLRGFEVNLIAYDPYLPKEVFNKHHIQHVDFETVLRKADVITLHVALTKETYHLIRENELRQMKKTAILINVCRGAVVDEQALYLALKEKWIAGAGLDVLEKEPLHGLIINSSLLDVDNVVISPHIGWYSQASLQEIQLSAVTEVVRVLSGRLPSRLVNKEVLAKQ
jgi:D-3-phosphoglycerate dehydrogenase